MKDFIYNFIFWLILQVLLPLIFVLYTFNLQYGIDGHDLLNFCKSQRLLLVSAMTFLNMAVVLVNTSRNNLKDDETSKRKISLYNLLLISGFVIIFMIYSSLITRNDLIPSKEIYIFLSIGTYVVTITAATLLKFDIERKLIKSA